MVDVLVVGAGIAGCSVAWHLGGRVRVAIVDAGPAPASESTADGVGMVRRLTDDPVERALAVRTSAWLRRFPPPVVRSTGAVVALARDPTALNDAAAHLRAAGVAVDAVSPGDVAPALRGSPVQTGWYLPDEALAQPATLCRAIAAEAVTRGATLHFGERVSAIEASGSGYRVTTSAGRWSAAQVVLATGAWSASLARGLGLDRRLVPLRRSVVHVVAPDAGGPWAWIDDVGLYARPTDGGWYVSPCDEAVSVPDDLGSRREVTEAATALARQKLARWMPALAGRPLLGGWSGLRTFATDRRPALGPDPERPGLWWATGLGGYGVTGGPAAGEAVAAWLLGDAVAWLRASLVAPGRRPLARWPIRPTGDHAESVLVSLHQPSSG